MTEHIVAVFETEAAADAAARDLEDSGIPRSAIRRYKPQTVAGAETYSDPGYSSESSRGGGFWAWLLGEESGVESTRSLYPEDEELYERGVHAGRTVLGVMLHDDSQIHQAVTILDAHHPIEIEEGTQEAAMGSAGEVMPAARGGEQVIPLAEEKIEVGKRTVDRGTTRIRRYVVQTPVERDVTLHGERVTIERRRPVSEGMGAPSGAFEERTVEVHETEEVPVVEKAARVVEEVAVRKEATERTETVRDTVRREEVEVTGKDGRPIPGR
jgi:uncharacterized protein (TIGR02271 family)